ncbi:MAG: sulfotransferase family 2 domain-containing protein, partial [Flavobacteriales bacterium]
TSIEKKLGHFNKLKRGAQDHRKIKEIEMIWNKTYNLRSFFYLLRKFKLTTSLYYLNNVFNPEISEKEYKSYFKFTFVRNTWARVYSWYSNVINDEFHRKEYNIPDNYSFKDFINYKLDHENFSQLGFLIDKNGNIPLDFIGRFENLQSDFSYVSRQIGLHDSQLPHLLNRGHKNYKEFYDNETKDLVYKFYKKEINYFEFHF